MKKTFRTKNSYRQIIICSIILGLSVFLMSGCDEEAKTPRNETAVNSETTVSNNDVAESDSTSTDKEPTDSNSAESSPTQKQPETATKEKETATKEKDSNEKSDCTVIEGNADYFVSATEKTIKLKKGTEVNVIDWQMHQGLYAVNAKIDGKWVKGEIQADFLDCPEEEATETDSKK